MTATRISSQIFARVDVREARLAPEFASLYPGIPAGEWQAASMLADCVLAGRLLRGSSSALQGRVLPEEHFDFRGGDTEHKGVRVTFRPRR
jgi:hypothetical protein